MGKGKLKFGIVGAGRIAQRHAEHIANVGSLVAVCDIVQDKAESLAQKYAAKSYTDLPTLLKKR